MITFSFYSETELLCKFSFAMLEKVNEKHSPNVALCRYTLDTSAETWMENKDFFLKSKRNHGGPHQSCISIIELVEKKRFFFSTLAWNSIFFARENNWISSIVESIMFIFRLLMFAFFWDTVILSELPRLESYSARKYVSSKGSLWSISSWF